MRLGLLGVFRHAMLISNHQTKEIKFKITRTANSGKTNKNRTEVLEWHLYTRSTEKPHNSQSAWTQKTRGGEVRSRGLGDFLNEKKKCQSEIAQTKSKEGLH